LRLPYSTGRETQRVRPVRWLVSSGEKMAEARRFVVRGRVQGVGFRWFVEHEAHVLGIAGWVRNKPDGSVEVLAMGSRDQLAGLRSRLREGPRAARVDDVEESEAKPIPGLVPVRKPGKLPSITAKYDYELEYGKGTLEIHKDAIEKDQRVIIVDDLLATGGTADATARLVRSLGGEIAGLGFVVELDFLKG